MACELDIPFEHALRAARRAGLTVEGCTAYSPVQEMSDSHVRRLLCYVLAKLVALDSQACDYLREDVPVEQSSVDSVETEDEQVNELGLARICEALAVAQERDDLADLFAQVINHTEVRAFVDACERSKSDIMTVQDALKDVLPPPAPVDWPPEDRGTTAAQLAAMQLESERQR